MVAADVLKANDIQGHEPLIKTTSNDWWNITSLTYA